MKQLHWLGAAVVALTLLPVTAQGQQTGTITGTVLDQATGAPIAGGQVTVVGFNIGTITNRDGRYILSNVPAGEREVRVTLIGYSRASGQVRLGAGETATVDFSLRTSAIELEGLVVTTTGQAQRRREVGNTVANITVEDLELAPIQTFSQLLQGRAAGVSVLQSAGTTGTGARVRIRGSNSISLSNEPLLIVDGVRVDNAPNSFSFGIGGQSISRLNDINAEDIASIEILKGPAAAALYGTAAANGVIQITTRRGQAGATRWNAYSEVGSIDDRNTYPANFSQRGRLLVGPDAGAEFNGCDILLQSDGVCEPLELNSFNPLVENSPFRSGNLFTVGLNVSGGNEQVQFFVSGEREDEEGIYANNELERVKIRGNISANLHPNFDMSLRTSYMASRLQLPNNDNTSFGFVSAGLLGSAFDSERTGGFFGFPNDRRFALERFQDVNRTVGSLQSNWRPLTWLSLNATGGLDILKRDDELGVAPNIWLPTESPDNAIGNRFVNAGLIRNFTGRGNALATYQLTDDISAITTVGGEFLEARFQRVDAGGFNLLPGTRSLGALSERFSINEFDQRTRTVSVLGSQQFGWRDRVFTTVAARGDRNSNFGAEFGFQWYPSLSASWVIGEEPWFPQTDVLSAFRLRGAWGRAGLLPDFRMAEQFFSPVTATIQNASVPAITIGGAGNQELRPERSREVEFGVDIGILSDRVGVELTYFDKESSDALVSRRLAPSLGSSTTQTVNLGRVSNRGFEAHINARIIEHRNVDWDATLNLGTNRNRLLELGEGIEPIIFGIGGDSQRHEEGFPLGAYFGTRILAFEDANGDGIIGENEVTLSDEPEFLGTPFPKREISLSTGVTLFRFLRVSALLDHRGGHQLFNSTEEFRCAAFFNCRGIQDRDAPLSEQARATAAVLGSIDGYVEDADFTKLRELAFTVSGVERLARRAGVTGLDQIRLTVAGRNLATWTDYSGIDPELNSGGQANFSTFDFLGQPPVRTWTVRLDVGF
jgi:TonB-dependent starch-binding outer membrane protein SusC